MRDEGIAESVECSLLLWIRDCDGLLKGDWAVSGQQSL